MSSDQRSRLWKYGLALLLVAGAAFFVFSSIEKRGAKTKEALIDQYITAIRQENAKQIVQLTPSNHTSPQTELAKLIVDSGGNLLDQVQTARLPSEAGYLECIKLTGRYSQNGKMVEFIQIVYLERIEDRWYLTLVIDENGLPIYAPKDKGQVSF